MDSGGRSFLKMNFFIDSGLKMIQFKIQFKTKSRIFIQKNIHTIEYRIFNRTIHSKDLGKIIQSSNKRPNYGFGALHRTLYGSRTPEMDLKGPTELFEMSLNYFLATIFDAGKLKPEYIFKKTIHFFKSLFKTNIHFLNPEYSLKI